MVPRPPSGAPVHAGSCTPRSGRHGTLASASSQSPHPSAPHWGQSGTTINNICCFMTDREREGEGQKDVNEGYTD